MKLYKLRHIPTGLFFTPSKGNGNLSTKGKVYVDIIPRLEWIGNLKIVIWSSSGKMSKTHKLICDYFNLDFNGGMVNEYVKTNPEDWEIIELKND